MDFCQLNRTDLRVSRLCLGTMTFGNPADQAASTRMVERCLEAGINFFDTANAYQQGGAECLLGNALAGKRKHVVLASKVRNKMGDGPDEVGLSRRAIFRAVEDSLRRLQTDYLDIYYLHAPDYDVPVEETLDAMNTLVRQGKIRYIATSNYASWQVCEMLWLSEKSNYQAPLIAQPMYNLIARGIEQEFLPMGKRLGVSTIVYNPLAGGLLSGKHDPAKITPGSRFDPAVFGVKLSGAYQERYWRPQAFHAVEKLKKIAAGAGRSLPSLALNWLLHHSATDCVILGASRMEQLEQNLKACQEGPLPPEAVSACDAVWQEFRGPAPIYNR
jgi:aryl-alcohol dehydrogenase-like predicted oxidoreductase